MVQDKRSPIAINDPHFSENMEKIIADKGLEGFIDWVRQEMSEGRALNVSEAGGSIGKRIIFDRSVSSTENGRPVKILLPFSYELNANTSTLLGVYNLETKNGPIQLIIRVVPSDLTGKSPVGVN